MVPKHQPDMKGPGPGTKEKNPVVRDNQPLQGVQRQGDLIYPSGKQLLNQLINLLLFKGIYFNKLTTHPSPPLNPYPQREVEGKMIFGKLKVKIKEILHFLKFVFQKFTYLFPKTRYFVNLNSVINTLGEKKF